MYGGAHDDTYMVDNKGDRVFESRNQGYDRVFSTVGFTLGDNVEELVLQGNAYLGYGNKLNNRIDGNNSSNRLWGKSGNDQLNGNGGNDLLLGGTGHDRLLGGSGKDTLVGGSGNDVLVGGSGNDVLRGDAGKDKFTFFKRQDGVDQIKDFSRAQGDRIEVVAAGFGGGLAKGMLSSDQFVLGSSARDVNDRFLYKNGVLSFDADGVGGVSAVKIATLSGNPSLSHSDIFVI
jgi:Ca2+-binding RTX toxin-like protein